MANPPVLRFARAPARAEGGEKCITSILSLDGGGLRGIIEGCVLEELEVIIKELAVERKLLPLDGQAAPKSVDSFTVDVRDYFSIVAGTSTGAILAGYIAQNGDKAEQLLKTRDVQSAAVNVASIKSSVFGRQFQPELRPGSAGAAQAVYAGKGGYIFTPHSPAELRRGLRAYVVNELLANQWRIVKFGVGFLLRLMPRSLVKRSAGVTMAKFPRTNIENVIQDIFGTATRLSESKPGISLVVPTFDVLGNRPVVFYYDDSCKVQNELPCGFGTIRRFLKIDPATASKEPPKGTYSADIVRVPEDFLLWEAIRGSTAAPTFFPTMSVSGFPNADNNPPSTFQLTDGAVVANNPSLVATTFATSSYTNKLENLAVLSLGAGTSMQPSPIVADAGLLNWGADLISILMGGPSELTDALVRQIGASLLGDGVTSPCYMDQEGPVDPQTAEAREHFRRVQISANNAEVSGSNVSVEVVSLNGTWDTLADFLGDVKLSSPSILPILSALDRPDFIDDLLKIGYLLAKQESTRKILREFAGSFLLAPGPSSSTAKAADW